MCRATYKVLCNSSVIRSVLVRAILLRMRKCQHASHDEKTCEFARSFAGLSAVAASARLAVFSDSETRYFLISLCKMRAVILFLAAACAVSASPFAPKNVICPDGQTECPDGNTCCKLTSGQWGCCPLPNAVCCSDGEHCCPQGYTCDVSAGTCTRQDHSIPFFTKIQAQEKGESVVCPDGTSTCPDGNTCCKLTSGQWGCCPLPNAVCCSDHEHCCPQGYTCDVSAGTCTRQDHTIPFFTKIQAQEKGESVVCPDGQSECPDGNTCCKLTSGQWGCCPLPSAVCCSDHEHCCPQGYTCDVSAGTCTQQGRSIPFFTKIPAKPKYVPCPGGIYTCPDGNTCCQLSIWQWGCCPLPNAVCCSDHEYCCPQGYTCGVSAGTCTRQDHTIPFFTKIQAQEKGESVVCPDGKSECPDGNTCCKLSSGEWGCCPLPKAVCCSDHEHCCPQGYRCGVSAGTCTRQDHTIPFFTKIQAKPKDVPCPGGTYTCPDGNTCCQLTSGQWGCCPLPNAVCCSDHEHCCPQGDTCDVSAGTCNQQGRSIPFFTKRPALKYDKGRWL